MSHKCVVFVNFLGVILATWLFMHMCSHAHACCRYGDDLPEELRDFRTTVLVATFAGFFFGGMIGARHAGDKFIALNHSSKFTSVMQAQVSVCLLQK